tara:strand:+ start:1802 stop:1909 length:108 start_codon:yes stop_codon:yes gene_type:complete
MEISGAPGPLAMAVAIALGELIPGGVYDGRVGINP